MAGGFGSVVWFQNNGSEAFTSRTLESGSGINVKQVAVGDLNGDTRLDVVAAKQNANTVSWYRNDGGVTFSQQDISSAVNSSNAALVVDLDSDGDLDVVSSVFSNFVSVPEEQVWFRNNGSGTFTRLSVDATSGGFVRNFAAADLDGDSDVDLIAPMGADNLLSWYENDGSESFTRRTIDTNAGNRVSAVADFNGDGTLDVVSGAWDSRRLNWYAQTTAANPEIDVQGNGRSISDGETNPSTLDDTQFGGTEAGSSRTRTFTIGNTGTGALAVNSVTISGSNRFTISSQPSGSVAAGGSSTFGIRFSPTGVGQQSATVSISNNDADENPYMFRVEGTGVVPPTFSKAFSPTSIAQGGRSRLTFTIDNTSSASDATSLAFTDDMPAGMTVASPLGLAVTCRDGTFSTIAGGGRLTYTGGTVRASASCTIAVDVTASQTGSLVNTSGDLTSSAGNSGTASATLTVTTAAGFTLTDETPDNGAASVARDAGVTATFSGALNQSTVTTNTFTVRGSQTGERAGAFSFPASADKAQFDPDEDFLPGELVTVTASSGIENTAGTSLTPYTWQFRAKPDAGPGTFAQPLTTSGAFFAIGIDPADLDGDGDLDLVVSSTEGPGLYWVENEGGTLAAPQQILVVDRASTDASSIAVADLNGDGHLDLVSRNSSSRQTLWFENDGAADPTFTQRVVGPINFAFDVVAGDLDGDGDIDLISTGNAARFDVLSVYVKRRNRHLHYGRRSKHKRWI